MAKFLDYDGLKTVVEKLKAAFVTQDKLDARVKIIYPNGGMASSPAYIQINKRYILPNPFPGHAVLAIPQILVGGKWGKPGEFILAVGTFDGGYNGGYGVAANQLFPDDTIIVQTGSASLMGGDNAAYSGAPFSYSSRLTSAQARVIVYDLGPMP